MSQKDHIINEAARMFVSQGIKSVRMDDIASTAGVSKRTLYEMFGDKEELLKRCISRHFQQRREKLASLTAGAANVIEELMIIFDEMMRSSQVERRLMTNLRKFYPSVFRQVLGNVVRTDHEQFQQRLREGIRQGILRADLNIELSVPVFTYTLSSVLDPDAAVLPDDVSPEDAVRYVVINFFRGISTLRGVELIDELLIKWNGRKIANND